MEQAQHLRFKKTWSRKARIVFWSIFSVFLLGFIMVAVWAAFLASQVFALKQSVEEVQRAVGKYDLSAAELALDDAADYAKQVERTFSLAPFLSWIPSIGETYVAALQTLHVASEAFAVASQGLSVASSVTDAIDRAQTGTSFTFLEDPRPYSDFSDAERRAALTAFAQSASDLRSLRIALELAAQDVARIDADALRIPQAVAVVKKAQEEIPQLVTTLDILAPFASVTREFAGVDSETQFLILYLNNSELRPGGGFIGAYSLMNVDEGEITSFTTEDSYSADLLVAGNASYHVEPPTPIKQYIGIPDWYFRDAAWSPSFEQTAFDARQLLRQELSLGGRPVPDAPQILGITPDFIEAVLRLVGPISANGKTYTADNVYELLEYDVEQGFVDEGIPYEDRKNALKVISETMIYRLLEMSPSSWMDFFAVFEDELAQKHVMLASTDEATQASLEDAGWAGTFVPTSVDDVVMLVDANMGALKTDPVVKRSVDYAIAPTSLGYQATVTVTYNHTGSVDYKTGQYRTYAQLFVPEGSTLVSTTGLTHEVVTTDSLGMTSFGTFLEIDPGDMATISFIYNLPETVVHAIDRGVYTLGAFKQVGAGDNLLTLHLDFGTNLVAADPEEDPSDYGNFTYDYTIKLATDEVFRVTL